MVNSMQRHPFLFRSAESMRPARMVPFVCRMIRVLGFFASRFLHYIDGTTYDRLLGVIIPLLPPLDGPVESFCESPILLLMFEVEQFDLPTSSLFSQVCVNCNFPIIHYALTCLERLEEFTTSSLPLRAAHFLSSWTLAIPRQIADYEVIKNGIMTVLFRVALSRGTPDFILHAIRPLSCAAVSVDMEPEALLEMLMRAAILQPSDRGLLEESGDELWTNYYIAKRSMSLDHPRNCAISTLCALPEVCAKFWEYQPTTVDDLEVYIRFAAELMDDDHIELGFELYQVDCGDDKFCLFSRVYLLVRMSTLSRCPAEVITNEMVSLRVALVRDASGEYSDLISVLSDQGLGLSLPPPALLLPTSSHRETGNRQYVVLARLPTWESQVPRIQTKKEFEALSLVPCRSDGSRKPQVNRTRGQQAIRRRVERFPRQTMGGSGP
jgi:hypothetical protein